MQALQHGSFMVLLQAVDAVINSCTERVMAVAGTIELVLTAAKAPPSALQALRKDANAALQQVCMRITGSGECVGVGVRACGVLCFGGRVLELCAPLMLPCTSPLQVGDVGLGRWIKLLAARSSAHTRLKLYELRQLLDLTESAAASLEARGAKPPPSVRSALMATCKAFLDNFHSRSVMQLQHVLEAEQWVTVQVRNDSCHFTGTCMLWQPPLCIPCPAPSSGMTGQAEG